MPYVDLDAAREEMTPGVDEPITVHLDDRDYQFPASMNGDAYLRWNEALVTYFAQTGSPMSEWRPELGIPIPLVETWLEAALTTDQLDQMRADGLTIGQINSAAEYLYLIYIGIAPQDDVPLGEDDDESSKPLVSPRSSS